MPQQAASRFEPGAPGQVCMRWRNLWWPRKTAALKLRRRQGRESRPRCRIEGECFILWPPARRHPGRPTAANAAGGGESLRPLCLVRPGRGLYVGREARCAAGIPCPTSRRHGYQYHPDLEPGKFPRGGPAQGHPHPFRCAGMGVGCAAGGPLRRFDPGGPQIRERSTYRWDFPRKCLKPRPRWPSWLPGA